MIRRKPLRTYFVQAPQYAGIWGAHSKKDLQGMLNRKGFEYSKISPEYPEYALGDDWKKRLKRKEINATYGWFLWK